MNKFVAGLVASTLALSFTATSFVPANAAPLVAPQARPAASDQSVHDIQYKKKWRRHSKDRMHRRGDNRPGYWRGHRGSRHWRPGYRRHGDLWFPLAAFATGAIISGAIANNAGRTYRGDDAHVSWCYDRYRSYRESDNTFQPYNGPRQQCVSPY